MDMIKGIEIAVKYRGYVRLSDQTGNYVSWCPMLDIKSQGRSIEEARASLDDSVRLFVVHCFRRGILEEALKRRGLEEQPVDAPIEGDCAGEHISLRPVEATDTFESWEGQVPLNLVAAASRSKGPGAGAWQQ